MKRKRGQNGVDFDKFKDKLSDKFNDIVKNEENLDAISHKFKNNIPLNQLERKF